MHYSFWTSGGGRLLLGSGRIARQILVAVFITAFAAACIFAQRKTQNIILVTLDGARTQEIFGGLDEEIFRSTNKNYQKTVAYKRFSGATPTERREKLMPFFW